MNLLHVVVLRTEADQQPAPPSALGSSSLPLQEEQEDNSSLHFSVVETVQTTKVYMS